MTSTTVTIGQLAKQFGLSRSTLLYYDSISLLKPAGRSRANYRRYTAEDGRRLQMIMTYRQVGLSMASIREIIKSPQNSVRDILEKRLLALGNEIGVLREQQRVIISMLGDRSLRKRIPFMDKEGWITLLRAAGLDGEGMAKWHREFEKLSPLLHQEFLEGLGIPGAEIEQIRSLSRMPDLDAEMPKANEEKKR
ncbi:MAG: MerR family transcriptional regulator [Smithellaceae bacterium]|nr:MerR family transcriptional regulator [Smithellaceae bacterium]